MKTPSIALLNSIGFTNPAQKVLYAANALKLATTSSPSVTVFPAIPAVIARPEVVAQTAKPFRPATAAVLGGENTGRSFGELYLNSPAYLPGAPIPAIPDKPASAAVVGIPGVVGVSAVAAVISPAIVAIKGWEDAVSIEVDRLGNIGVIVELPYSTSTALIGAAATPLEITPSALVANTWLDVKASNNAEAISNEPATIEQYFYKYVKSLLALSNVGTIKKATKLVNGILIPVLNFNLVLAANQYDENLDSLQLNKVIITV
jgi:hypothetical protein